ncbi:hypothetical protein PYCC9005_001851 [Savitreella phatthalungensis]
MATKSVIRSGKNLIKGYSSIQVKVRGATSNDAWGPSSSDLRDIAEMTHDPHSFGEVMDTLDKRMNDRGKNWRHVYKALTVFDYILHVGSENVVLWGKDNIYLIKTLREFIYMDESNRDQGTNIRTKAKSLTALLQDDDRLRAERRNRSYSVERLNGNDEQERPLQPQRTGGAYLRRRANDDDGEDDDEMRRAIAESKRQAEIDERRRNGGAPPAPVVEQDDDDEDADLRRAIRLSEEEEAARKRRQQDESIFDDSNDQQFAANAYQQQQQVDFFGNPVYENMPQNTGYLQNAYAQTQQPQYTGYYPQQQEPQSQYEDYGGGQHDFLTAQNTGMNAATRIERQPTGRNNPFGPGQPQQPPQQQPAPAQRLEPVRTGNNNPFAQFGNISNGGAAPVTKPYQPQGQPTLNDMQQRHHQQPDVFGSYANAQANKPAPQRRDDRKYADLAALIGAGTGADTFGNTGETRIARHHTASQAFMNSAGSSSAGAIRTQQTGHNPFLHAQRTGPQQQQQQQQQQGFATGYVGTQQTGGFATYGQPQQTYPSQQHVYQQQPQQQQAYQQQPIYGQQSMYGHPAGNSGSGGGGNLIDL